MQNWGGQAPALKKVRGPSPVPIRMFVSVCSNESLLVVWRLLLQWCLISDTQYQPCNKLMPLFGYYLWIAGRRYHTHEFYWHMVSSQPQNGSSYRATTRMGFTYWHPYQPDNGTWLQQVEEGQQPIGTDEKCVNLWPQRAYSWNDERCDHTYCFVCENRNVY